MRSWELKGYVNKYSKLGKMDLIWLTNNKIKQAYLFSWLERYCEIIIGKRDRSSNWLHVWPLNSFYDCTETWPVERHSIIFYWIPVCYMCSECYLVYILWTVSSTWSGTKIKLHCSCVVNFTESTIQSTLLQCLIQC